MWGLDLSGSLQGAGGVGGLLEVVYKGAQTTNCFVAFDGNGNVTLLADAASTNILAKYEYGPFGEVIRATGPMAKANPFRFSTKYQDDETDLLYYGYRFYSASMGRWLNTDPIEEQGGKNLRCFVGNQPITQSDPLGLFSIDNQGVFTGNEVAQINRKVVDACTKRFDSLVNKDCTLYPCIKKKCQSGTITLSSDTPKQNTQGQMIPTLGRAGDTMRNIAGWGNDVTLYPKNGGPSTDWGGVAIHEWAHCCGWVHGESGLDPSISGSSM